MFGKFSINTLLAAAALAVLTTGTVAAGGASAAPFDHHDRDRHVVTRFDHRGPVIAHRHYVERTRIVENLRLHNFRVFGDPYFVRGHYVVRSHDRFGHLVFVEVDPWTGAFLGTIRL